MVGILLFLRLRSPCKFLEPYDNPFWEIRYRVKEREKKKKKNTENSGLPKLKLKPHAKFQNPWTAPSGRKVTGLEERREREEEKKINVTFV